MTSHGVSRSESETTQKSCPSGAPSTAPPESAAVTPATTRISTAGNWGANCSSSPAMPYTPASPLHTKATSRPDCAVSSAQRQRSSSFVIGEVYVSFPGKSGATRST